MQPTPANDHSAVDPGRSRRIVKRLLLTGTALVLFALSMLALALIYYSRHPQAVKTLLEKAVADAIHGSCSIDDLSYSIRRGYVRARGIHLKSESENRSFDLQAANFAAGLALNGPFGARRLVIRSVSVENFAIVLNLPWHWPNPSAGKATRMQHLLTRLRRFWLFKEAVLSSAFATSGSLRLGASGWRLTTNNLSARLDTKWRLRLDGSAAVQSAAGAIRAVVPQFLITTGSLRDTGTRPLSAQLQISAANLHSAAGALETVTAAIQLSYLPRRRRASWEIRRLDTRHAVIHTQRALSFKTLSLQAHGTWDTAAARLRILHWNLKAGSLAALTGNAAATLKPPGMLYVGLQTGSLHITNLVRLLGPQAAGRPPKLRISKPMALDGWLRLSGLGQKQRTAIHLTGRLSTAQAHYTNARRREILRSLLNSTIRVDGALGNPRISLAADLQQAVFGSRPRQAIHFSAALRASGHYPGFELSQLTACGTTPALPLGRRFLPRMGFELSLARGRIDVQRRQLDLPDVAVALDTLKNLHLAVSGGPAHLRITLNGAGSRLLPAAATLHLLPPAWQFKATDRFAARAVYTHGNWQAASVRLNLHDFSFASPDGQAGAEKIDTEITGRLSRSSDGQGAILRVKAAADNGEILWGRFYADMVRRRPRLSAAFAYNPHTRKVTLTKLRLSLKDLLQVQAQGAIAAPPRAPELTLGLKVPPTAAVPLFKWLAVDPFRFDLPVLASLQIGGRLGLDLNLSRRQRRWRMKGRLLWHRGRLATKDKRVDLQDIDLDLPFWNAGAGPAGDNAALSGHLRIRRLRMPYLRPQPLSLRLLAAPGRISASGFTLETAGGKLHLGHLTADHICGTQPVIETSLTIPALQLERLADRAHIPAANATASGKLAPLVMDVAHGRLSGRGTIRIAAYGGTIKLHNPVVVSLFSPLPALMLDVAFGGINLDKLTAGTSFGRIEGILNGHIRHLEIVDGQPQRFDLLAETVKRKGVPQKISVKAVENISRIGGVPSPFVGLAGVFAGLLKSFGYRKIGVKASLKNDVFHINGTIREGGREYLVKRGGLSGVDVVNWNPDNRISFTDMLKRLERIRSAYGRPVVK